MLNSIFSLNKNNTSIKNEIYAALITFVSMSYIAFINPLILKDTGINPVAVFISTCLITGVFAIITGFFVNLPLILSTGMGLNAVFTYTIVLTLGYSWQQALAMVFIVGLVITIVAIFFNVGSLFKAVPQSLKYGISAGIGLFIIFIALKNSEIIVKHPATLVSLGKVSNIITISILLNFILLVWAHHKKLYFMPLFSIFNLTVLSLFLNKTSYLGLTSFNFNISSTLLAFDFTNLYNFSVLIVVITIFMGGFFDAFGALLSYGYLINKNLDNKTTKKAFLLQGISSMSAGALGTSDTTFLLESNAGVSFGGRTGLTAVIVGLLFLLIIIFSPLINAIPVWAATPTLMYLGFLMLSAIKNIDYNEITNYIPALLCVIIMPLTYSIGIGIGFGFISYVALKLAFGKFNEINKITYLVAVIFLIDFILK